MRSINETMLLYIPTPKTFYWMEKNEFGGIDIKSKVGSLIQTIAIIHDGGSLTPIMNRNTQINERF